LFGQGRLISTGATGSQAERAARVFGALGSSVQILMIDIRRAHVGLLKFSQLVDGAVEAELFWPVEEPSLKRRPLTPAVSQSTGRGSECALPPLRRVPTRERMRVASSPSTVGEDRGEGLCIAFCIYSSPSGRGWVRAWDWKCARLLDDLRGIGPHPNLLPEGEGTSRTSQASQRLL
jgi:hypothetical protein